VIKRHLGGADFWKPALRLSLPVALQHLLGGSFTLIDTLMLGRLGDEAVASVGMAGQWAWLLNIFFYGMSSGAAVFLSQYWGAKDHGGIRRSYGMLAAACLALAGLMCLAAVLFPGVIMRLFTSDTGAIETGVRYLHIAGLSYMAIAFSQIFSTVLRSTEEVRLPLYASILGVLLNTALNYAFIFGKLGLPELGVPGAAIATVISAWACPIFLFFASFKRRNVLICPPRDLFHFDRAFGFKFFRVSLPALANEGLWALGTMGYNMVYGHMGTAQYAALTIYRTVDSLFFAFYIGLCHACSVLVGREIGAGRVGESVQYANRFTLVMPALSIFLGLIVIATRGMFLTLFTVSPEVLRLANAVLLICAAEIPIRNIPFITICGIFRAGGDTKIGVMYDLISVWCMALPVTIFCGLVVRLNFLVVFAVMLLCEDWLKAVLCVRRLRSGKWIKPVVEAAL